MAKANRNGAGGARSNANICFTCENACGKCSWSAVDEETGKLKFEPVPGWTAKLVKLRIGVFKRRSVTIDTYHITDCPQYKPTRRGRSNG